MRIRADFGVGHPAAEVWALLASEDGPGCVPGLAVSGPSAGSLEFDVEARHLVFEGSAAAASDRRARTVTVEARGEERSGLGRARTTLILRVDEDGLFSTVNVEADLHLSGEISSMARLIAEAAYRLADGIAECLDAALGAGSLPPAASPVPEAVPDEAGAVQGWLRRFLGRVGRSGKAMRTGGGTPSPPSG
jgi:carbon monoxide dehydrogenase subunit G